MTLQLLRPEDVATGALARWGIYAQNGVGKTTFASTVCRCQDATDPCDPSECLMTLVVSADQENIKPYFNKPHITVLKILRWDDTVDVHMMLAKGVKHPTVLQFVKGAIATPGARKDAFAKRLAAPGVKDGSAPFFQAVVFDTMTRLQALAVNKLVGAAVISPEDTMKFLTTPPLTPRGFETWDAVGKLAADGMRSFNLLPIHCLYLFQEMLVKENKTGVQEGVTIAMTPAARSQIQALLEMVGRLYIPFEEGGEAVVNLDEATNSRHTINPEFEEKRKLLLGKHDWYFSKGDTLKLGYVVDNPIWTTLAASLQ